MANALWLVSQIEQATEDLEKRTSLVRSMWTEEEKAREASRNEGDTMEAVFKVLS